MQPSPTSSIQIIDTFRFTNKLIVDKELHLLRSIESYNFFNIQIDSHYLKLKYDEIEKKLALEVASDLKVRLLFDLSNSLSFSMTSQNFIPLVPPIRLKKAVIGFQKSGLGVGNIKTTQRSYWDDNQFLMTESFDDVIGINDQGFVTETSRFNLFFKKNNQFFTPTLSTGCLNGIYRRKMMLQGCVEADFKFEDISEFEIYLGNSLHGMVQGKLGVGFDSV